MGEWTYQIPVTERQRAALDARGVFEDSEALEPEEQLIKQSLIGVRSERHFLLVEAHQLQDVADALVFVANDIDSILENSRGDQLGMSSSERRDMRGDMAAIQRLILMVRKARDKEGARKAPEVAA